MIKNLEIKNFKSIKHLELNCKKINLFIGEPNTGKSNILETLGILSVIEYRRIEDFVRFERMSNLFYDENLDDGIEIRVDDMLLEIEFEQGHFKCIHRDKDVEHLFFDYDYYGKGPTSSLRDTPPVKCYKFAIRKDFPEKESDFLLPPYGANLLAVLMSHKSLKSTASHIFEPFGFKLAFRPHEDKIEISKLHEDVFIFYPYSLASETLQRVVFYTTAMDSNKNSILVFEEPESHSFPYYTKHLGERIAFDETNQYFIATHNPYLLLSILEKAHKNSVNVFITYFRDYQTKVKCLTDEQMSELMDYDPFFNLHSFIEEEENR